MWGVRDREVGVVREATQGGEEGVGCVGRVILLDCEGQGERHEKVQEGAFCSSLGDPAAWLQEGGEACSPMILWGILRPKPHLRYRTGSETAQRI